MKDKSIVLAASPKYKKRTQCTFKKPYKFKRRAKADVERLALAYPNEMFTVYECPHCGKYHVGKIRKSRVGETK